MLGISTEVNKSDRKEALQEIYKEIKRLQETEVGPDELNLVKQYLLGSTLSSLDGVYNVAKVIKSLVLYKLDIDYFYKTIQELQQIQGTELIQLAQKYMDRESLYEIVAE